MLLASQWAMAAQVVSVIAAQIRNPASFAAR